MVFLLSCHHCPVTNSPSSPPCTSPARQPAPAEPPSTAIHGRPTSVPHRLACPAGCRIIGLVLCVPCFFFTRVFSPATYQNHRASTAGRLKLALCARADDPVIDRLQKRTQTGSSLMVTWTKKYSPCRLPARWAETRTPMAVH